MSHRTAFEVLHRLDRIESRLKSLDEQRETLLAERAEVHPLAVSILTLNPFIRHQGAIVYLDGDEIRTIQPVDSYAVHITDPSDTLSGEREDDGDTETDMEPIRLPTDTESEAEAARTVAKLEATLHGYTSEREALVNATALKTGV